jgi:asparagine synthase (glutamine-hydrolysing)
MCGITGFYQFRKEGNLVDYLDAATNSLHLRGPDAAGTYAEGSVGLGHRRLSIIDTSTLGNQPMSDPSDRYTIVFNGEIFNYKELIELLPNHSFRSTSDTEVLLHLLIKEGSECLQRLNGFFALAFYDKETDSLLLARDRMGIKPLHYYQDQDQVIFGSEMKAVMSFPIPRKLNQEAL